MSRIKTIMKLKNSKRRLIKKNQEEMKIKNKVNVERTFMRERFFNIHIMSLKTSTEIKKKKRN